MLNVDELPENIVRDLKSRGHSIEEIKIMQPAMAFDEYCRWNNLGEWGPILRGVMSRLKNST